MKTLKIFKLSVVDDIERFVNKQGGYFSWYSDPTDAIVIADSEEEARQLIFKQEETYDYWLNSELTTCTQIDPTIAQVLLTQVGTG